MDRQTVDTVEQNETVLAFSGSENTVRHIVRVYVSPSSLGIPREELFERSRGSQRSH